MISVHRNAETMQNASRSMLEADEIFAGRYRILRRLAAGGMGVVYEARHVETERPCALKVMLPHVAENEALRERFRLEARAAALVSSTHVVEVLDAGVDEATKSPFLVMELLRGEDLGKRMKRRGPLPRGEVVKLVEEAARGLDALHKASIVHRDLKPSNLFVAERDGEAPKVKVLDLGVAKRVAETFATTAAVGTPFYMAPEQLENGKITPAVDVFALGMVTYSLLAGREYWAVEAKDASSTLALALTMIGGPLEPPSARAAPLGVALPDTFDGWFFQATARDPGARFPSASAAASALAGALGEAGTALPKAPEEATATTTSRDAPTVAEAQDKPAATRTRTLGEGARPAATNRTPPSAKVAHDKPTRRTRLAATVALAAIVAVSTLAFLRARKPEPKPEPKVEIGSLVCSAATMTGRGASPELAEALGKGACVRLAVELGVPFGETNGTSVAVRADVGETETRVSLTAAGIEATGTGKTPIVATNQAIAALQTKVSTPPMTPERAASWGEKDEANARRIERLVHRKAFGFADDVVAEARAIAQASSASALPQATLACALRGMDDAGAKAAKERALAALGTLPEARARLVEGLLRTYVDAAPEELDRGVALLLTSYGELAEDPDFASLYTLCGCIQTDQTFPMVDWLAARWRGPGLPILRCSFAAMDTDSARQTRYLGWMRDVLPEMRGWFVRDMLESGKLDEARAAIAETRALGSSSRADLLEDEAVVALASLDPRAALASAEALFGEPNPVASRRGAYLRIEALLLAGRVTAAKEALRLEIGRSRAMGADEHVADLEERAADLARILTPTGADRRDASKAAADYRAQTNPWVRRRAAFEGALALEAIGAKDEADKAYALALERPFERGFEAIAARVRLIDLARAAGRPEDARALEAVVDRAWAEADPALRDAVRKMK
jgi:serine/threonine-protein kinase